jgi:type III restriction enzyme
VRAASENELDENGAPFPPERRLVVFPGMELTLDIPCQALLILDADLPEGAPDNVVRTVTENARTLKFKSQGFEEE